MEKISCISYNCKGFKPRNINYIDKLYNQCDILFLQEHWLHSFEFDNIYRDLQDCQFLAKSSMRNDVILSGRPYGGVAIVWKRDSPFRFERVDTESPRLVAIRAHKDYTNILFINVYMPCNTTNANEEFIDILTEIVTLCNIYDGSDVVLGGDFNCDLAVGDARVNILEEFLSLTDLKPLVKEVIYNIQYTFVNTQNHTSLIDHFFINPRLGFLVDAFRTISEGDNLSDHLPLKLVFSLNLSRSSSRSTNGHQNFSRPELRFNWSESLPCERVNYKCTLKHLLSSINIPSDSVLCCNFNCNDHYEEFVKYQYCIMEAIEFASLGSIRYFNSHLNKSKVIKGWSENVERFRVNAMFWHEIWKDMERPTVGVVADIRRATRSAYHRAIKDNGNFQNDIIKFNVASNLMSCNSRLFWKEVRKISGNDKHCPVPIGDKTGQEACNLFKDKYNELYNNSSPNNLKNICDNKLQSTCLNTVNVPDQHLHSISSVMVKNAVKNLNKGKKDDSVPIYSDSIIEGPEELYVHLANLFTIMLRHSYSSDIFNLVVFSPLIKDERKDHGDIDNYRAIALNSCIGKLLDYIILDFFKNKLRTSSNQFSYKEKFSTTLCTYVVMETIQYYQSRGTNVIASCLDFSKAFDMVKYSNLFDILIDRNICPLVLKLLIHFYSNIFGQVKWAGFRSDTFKINNGVKQGGVFSPVLFTLYIDVLIKRIMDERVGCFIGNRNTSILVYADDVILLTPSFNASKRLFKVCESFSCEYGLKFNVKKSEIILYGDFDNVPVLSLDNQRIRINNKIKYLGNTLTNNNNIIDYNGMISDIKVRSNVILSKFNFLNFESKREIFRSQITSYYGCELLNLRGNIINRLDVAWRVGARRLLGIHYRTHCDLLPPLMNSRPPSTDIIARILKFYYGGINFNDNFISFIFKNSFYSMSSIMCQNMFFIMRKLSKNIFSLFSCDFQLSSAVRKLRGDINLDWRAGLVSELLMCRDGTLASNLTSNDINLILYDICVL